MLADNIHISSIELGGTEKIIFGGGVGDQYALIVAMLTVALSLT